jgi:hypothetical protein
VGYPLVKAVQLNLAIRRSSNVRFTLLCASTALAASLLLSACSSGGGSQSIPGGGSQAVAPMGHSAPHLVAMNRGASGSCPSAYLVCIDLSKKTPGTASICISTSGNCTSGLVGEWNWVTVVTNLKGKSEKKHIKNSWSPNPGNPSTDTFKEKGKVKKSKNGAVKYVGNVTTCEVTNPSSCLTTAIGIITQ